ncbi:MAG: hypothetical protein IJJ71_09430 [Treponema sp.]|uniref:hypothetical protein n=1 Tax=Treponema sp. TaxID=166 RepID=UPI0025EAAFD4|nr:hypothetical protein [Treponema sp.]MBR0496380.1 hypothetical protein [Treponema sp.]
MTDTILCVDIGTSSLKAALLPDNLRAGEIFVSRQYFSEEAVVENRVAEEWLPCLKAAVAELTAKNPDYAVEAVCVSGNGPTVVTDDGTTLLYNQLFVNGGRGQAGNLSAQKKLALKNTKSLFIPRFCGFKLNFPFSWNDSAHIFGAPEFLIHELTGESVAILPEERFLPAYWNEDELKKCGFSEDDCKKFPGFVKAGNFVGKVSASAAIATGLLEGTLVFAGAPDFVVALIGTGTVFPGRLCDRAGTSEGLNLCTSKPVFAEGLRTLPSVVSGLWNVSYLINSSQSLRGHRETSLCENPSHGENPSVNSVASVRKFDELSHGINLLREAALSYGEYFPDFMTITGGQALNESLVAQKEAACGIKIKKMPCGDAELLGDLILARVGLGDYDDITEAVFAILG